MYGYANFGAAGGFGALQPRYLQAYGVVASQCSTLQSQIDALNAAKVPWYKSGHKDWKAQLQALQDAQKQCTKGSPIVDATSPLGPVDTSTSSSAVPMIAGATAVALLAVGTIAFVQSRRKNPRRSNRRRNSRR